MEGKSPYNIYVENGVLDKAGDIIGTMYKRGTRVMIFSDTNVFPLYGKRLRDSLEKSGFTVSHFIFEAGEGKKHMGTVMEMYKALTDAKITRTDLVVALGGGVAGDMGGFAAATYLRGIDIVQIPTTLLAQVDSSVGGKTGVDLPSGKNLIGAFHNPRAVITDPSLLKTLEPEYFVDGLGEVVKYGCICDLQLFEGLESGGAIRNIEDTIIRCITHKKKLVEEDQGDKGRRMILNFGHTFGHALEKLHNYTDLSHGRAVAIGMCMVTRMGESLSLTEKGTADRLEALLKKLRLPVEDSFDLDKVIDATALDKKSSGKMLSMIFIKNIGQSFIHEVERNYLVLKYKILKEQQERNAKSNIQ